MIFDCFTFFDELLLLELRLNELDGVVDRFVLVEADRTYQGAPKPLHYFDQRARFSRWASKIIHVAVRDLEGGDPWHNEHAQRRAVMRGLSGAHDTDVIIIGDADEIPRASAVSELPTILTSGHPLLALDYDLYYFKFNLKVPRSWQLPKAKACLMSALTDPQALREQASIPVLPAAGWHFSYLGDLEGAQRKLAAFAHSEFNLDCYRSTTHLERCQQLGVDPYGRYTMNIISDARTLPAWVAAHRNELAPLIQPPGALMRPLFARCYQLMSRHRREIPYGISDRHPVVGFVAAAAYVALRRLYRVVNPWA